MESNADTSILHKMFLINRADRIIQYINAIYSNGSDDAQEILSNIIYELYDFQERVNYASYSDEELLNFSQELIQREEDLGAMLPNDVPMSSSGIEEIDIRGNKMAMQRNILSVINEIDDMILLFQQEGLDYVEPLAQTDHRKHDRENHVYYIDHNMQTLFQRFNVEKQSFFSSPDENVQSISSRLTSFLKIRQMMLSETIKNMEKNFSIDTKIKEITQRYAKICEEFNKLSQQNNNMILQTQPHINELSEEVIKAQDYAKRLLEDWRQYLQNSRFSQNENNFQYLSFSFSNWLHKFKDMKVKLESIDAKLKSVTAQLSIKEDAKALPFIQRHQNQLLDKSNNTNINNLKGLNSLNSFRNQGKKFTYELSSDPNDRNNMFNQFKSCLSPNSFTHCCACQNCYNRTAPYCHEIMQNRNYPNMLPNFREPMIGFGFGNDRFADEMRLRDYMNTMELHHRHDMDMINHRLNFENMLHDRDRFLEEQFDRKLGDLINRNDIFATPNGYINDNQRNVIPNNCNANNTIETMSYNPQRNEIINNNASLVPSTYANELDDLANHYLN